MPALTSSWLKEQGYLKLRRGHQYKAELLETVGNPTPSELSGRAVL